MNLVEHVVSAGLCTGCGLCESIADNGTIRMQLSPMGFLRPVIAKTIGKDEEKAIAATCPGVQIAHEPGIKNYHVNWGPLQAVNVGYATDPEVRRMGSSGGVISALCIHLLESGAVDFIAQIAASPSNPVANEMQISRTRADVIRAAGSRYAPSAPLRSLRELLATGERFAFVGKPCDVAALRAFLRHNLSSASQIPYLISFMCAGIPSERATYDVVRAMGGDPERLQSFRYRGDGWPGMAKAIQTDGAVFEMDYNNSWGNILGKQLQFRCKICADGTGELADVVCADAWYGKDGYPDFAERDGRSLILARTDSGKRLLDTALELKAVSAESIPIADIARMQPYQLTRKQLAAFRGVATLVATGRTTRFKRLRLARAATGAGVVNALRNAWGTYRRAHGETLPERGISLDKNK